METQYSQRCFVSIMICLIVCCINLFQGDYLCITQDSPTIPDDLGKFLRKLLKK